MRPGTFLSYTSLFIVFLALTVDKPQFPQCGREKVGETAKKKMTIKVNLKEKIVHGCGPSNI